MKSSQRWARWAVAALGCALAACGPVGDDDLDWASESAELSVNVPVGSTLQAVKATSLYASATKSSTVRLAIALNTKVVTVDYARAVNGFYKARYRTTTGWIPSAAVVLAALPPATPASSDGVSIVYAIPSDKQARPGVAAQLSNALNAVQAWTARSGDGRTFRIADNAPLQVVAIPRIAAALGAAGPGENPALAFHAHVVDEVFRAIGANYGQPRRVWIIYVEADPPCGSLFGGASVPGGAGVAVLPANDIRGLVGEAPINLCTGAVDPAWPVCRWVGGLGHELGHALGVPHPPGCDAGDPACDANDLMWQGYASFPSTGWNAGDRAQLLKNPLFGAFPVKNPNATCR